MAILVDGIIATGSAAFRAGASSTVPHTVSSSPSDGDDNETPKDISFSAESMMVEDSGELAFSEQLQTVDSAGHTLNEEVFCFLYATSMFTLCIDFARDSKTQNLLKYGYSLC